MSKYIFRLRRGKKDDDLGINNWVEYEKNPDHIKPYEGELVLEYDNGVPRLKIGDGINEFSQLPYMSIDSFILPKQEYVNLSAEWITDDSDNRYYQEVEVNGVNITSKSKVDLQPTSAQLSIFHEKDLAFVAENNGGTVRVYCVGQVPENSYDIPVTVTEVVTDDEIIVGNTTATPNPRPDWNQTDETKADYIKNKPTPETFIPNKALEADRATCDSQGNNIADQFKELENSITDKTETLGNRITETTAELNNRITDETEELQGDINTKTEKLQSDLSTVEDIAKGAQKAISVSDIEELVNRFNAATLEDGYVVGQSVYIQTLEVPDVWISDINDSSSAYNYTNDDEFIEGLADGVPIGYFVFSKLETQKVNFTNYAYAAENKLVYHNGETLQPVTADMVGAMKKSVVYAGRTPDFNNNITSKYDDYPCVGEITIEGLTADSIIEVIFGVDQAISGNYAPIAESSDGCIYIYAKTSEPITIPTIIVLG